MTATMITHTKDASPHQSYRNATRRRLHHLHYEGWDQGHLINAHREDQDHSQLQLATLTATSARTHSPHHNMSSPQVVQIIPPARPKSISNCDTCEVGTTSSVAGDREQSVKGVSCNFQSQWCVVFLLADIRNELRDLGQQNEHEDSPFHVDIVSNMDQLQNMEHSLSDNLGRKSWWYVVRKLHVIVTTQN